MTMGEFKPSKQKLVYNDLPIMQREELQSKLLTVGGSVRLFLTSNNDFYKVHIEAITQYPGTDDDLHKMITYRFYGKCKQYWHYEVTMLWKILAYNGHQGVIKELKLTI